jgi:hypothetical protein
MDAQKKEEWYRNRDRMAEITHLEAQNKAELASFLHELQSDESEFE